MRKLTKVSLMMLVSLCLSLGIAGAAITGAGGTEDFSGISLDDETSLTLPADLAGWTLPFGSAPGANDGAAIDNNTNGTSDGSGFGGTSPPENVADIKLVKWASANNAYFALISPTVGNPDDVTYTWYAAQTGAVPAGTGYSQKARNQMMIINFPDSSTSRRSVGFIFEPGDAATSGGGDLRVYNGTYSNPGWTYYLPNIPGALGNVIGVDDNDGNDYLLGEWNKFEVAINITEAPSTGTATLKYNDATIDTVALADAGSLLTTRLMMTFASFVQGGVGSRLLYLDDVNVTGPNLREDDWHVY